MTLFVTKGDKPLTPVQLERRAQTYIKRSWPAQDREKSIRLSDGAFDAFMVTFSSNHATNVANNTFNWQIQDYRKASSRLARYRLADGVPKYGKTSQLVSMTRKATSSWRVCLCSLL